MTILFIESKQLVTLVAEVRETIYLGNGLNGRVRKCNRTLDEGVQIKAELRNTYVELIEASVHETTGFCHSMFMFWKGYHWMIYEVNNHLHSQLSARFLSQTTWNSEGSIRAIAEKTGKPSFSDRKRSTTDARYRCDTTPYKVGDLVSFEEKAVAKGLCKKFHNPWTRPQRVVK